jgi:uncharacterized repeat protein (TIGR03803 family)
MLSAWRADRASFLKLFRRKLMQRQDFLLDRNLFRGLALTVAIAILTLALSVATQAQTETVIYSFRGGFNPNFPVHGLVFDAAGNLYGTAVTGGPDDIGAVYELSPLAGGGWGETTLHGFTSRPDGSEPYAPLTIDGAGNLYGATNFGGGDNQGTIYELTPVSGGGWNETLLHSFTGGPDGSDPVGGLVFDSAGNLYGTASSGGAHGQGTVFKLSPVSGGGWLFTVLHAFSGGADGGSPAATLVFDSVGNLYGTTESGGILTDCTSSGGCGVVFELSPAGVGWHETVVHAFNDTDGALPLAGVTLDASGNLYGTAFIGGDLSDCHPYGCGVIFQLSPVAGGGWRDTVIHTFTGGTDGANPTAGLAVDSLGNIYGTTQTGGTSTACSGGCGLVFEFSFSSGSWNQTILHDFNDHPDGAIPNGIPIFDAAGNLYSTTGSGGNFNQGTVFEITP